MASHGPRAAGCHVVVISDAMWKPPCTARLCYLVFTAEGQPFGHWIDIPSAFWALCPSRDTQIMVAELLAPVIALRNHPEVFRGAAATWYIDNVAAVPPSFAGRHEPLTCVA